jgi:3-oxosteroid 1-dehydrogenase
MSSEPDVIVVGCGLGGLATALAAAVRGQRVTILEKAEKVGGAAAYSGGQVWIPANHVQLAAGIEDTVEEGEQYVRAASADRPETLDEAAMHVWLEAAPKAAKYFEDLGAVQWELIPNYPDYYLDLPGSKRNGRYITAVFDATKLGEWRDRLLVSPHFPVGFTYDDLFAEGYRQLEVEEETESQRTTAFGSSASAEAPPAPAKDKLTFGTGVVAGFLARVLEEDSVEIRTEHRVTELLTQDGRVVGVRAETADGESVELRGPVVLATSAFDWDPELVKECWGLDEQEAGSLAPPSITGDGLRMARAIGAKITILPGNYAPIVPGYKVDTDLVYEYLLEHASPNTFCVDESAKRFTDDGTYWGLTKRCLDPNDRHMPCYMIWDSQHRAKYGLGSSPPGQEYPAGIAQSAPTLRELGEKLGIDGEQLEKTAERFNQFAVNGEDPDFGRGTNESWNLFTGDPKQKPNPNVGPVTEPPFFGMRIRFVGTGIGHSGIQIDTMGRVVDTSDNAIDGLYAVGSSSALTTSGVGYNSGFALSRAITFAYLVADLLERDRAAKDKTMAGH